MYLHQLPFLLPCQQLRLPRGLLLNQAPKLPLLFRRPRHLPFRRRVHQQSQHLEKAYPHLLPYWHLRPLLRLPRGLLLNQAPNPLPLPLLFLLRHLLPKPRVRP